MASSYNRVILMGRLTRDPQPGTLPSGTAVCELGLAANRRWRDRDTGHPGGVATVHANSAADALHRLEDLAGEASATVPRLAIASAANVVAFIERRPGVPGRRVREVARVTGVGGDGYRWAGAGPPVDRPDARPLPGRHGWDASGPMPPPTAVADPAHPPDRGLTGGSSPPELRWCVPPRGRRA